MFRRIPKISAAAIWAFLSTLSAAASTLVYITLAANTEWGPNFIQLYSVVGLFSGWANALIFFFSPHYSILQTKAAALLIYLLGIIITLSIFSILFSQRVYFSEIFFTAGTLIPILYANAFGLEFSEGNYPWAYKRVIFFNIILLIASLAACTSSHQKESLFLFTGYGAAFLVLFFYNDPWRIVENKKISVLSPQAWINPAVPILERTVWDQLILSKAHTLSLSIWVYLVGRVLSFIGNFTYSFLMGRASNLFSKLEWKSLKPIIFLVLAIVSIGLSGIFFSWSAILYGQIFSWTLSVLMALWFRHAKLRHYFLCILCWLIDLVLRYIVFKNIIALDVYLHWVLIITTFEFILLAYLLLRYLKVFREIAKTTFHSAGSPSSH